MSKPRILITDEERIEIALAYHQPGVKLKELEARFKRDKATLSRAVADAFERGLVEIKRVDRPHYRRDAQLEEQLRASFGLQTPVVVETGLHGDSHDPLVGDKVHDVLGKAAASLIAMGALFRKNDIIGLGSGRAVFHTIESLEGQRLGVSNITLVSLTGDIGVRSHARQINVHMDADTNVDLLSRSFSSQIRVIKTCSLISHGDAAVLKAIRGETWLSSGQWSPPTVALMGVGVLVPGHRFYDLAHSGDTDQMLASLKEDLKKLVNLCARASSDADHCPVADICNHLFFVAPPHARNRDHAREEQIRNLIEDINNKLLNVGHQQLKQIENIILVAGTRQKALAIRELLLHRDYKISILCTDIEAARAILSYN